MDEQTSLVQHSENLLRHLTAFALFLIVLGCQPGGEEPSRVENENLGSRPADFDPSLVDLVPDDLWRAANHGRVPLREDGTFDFPDQVRRVWVDVGAYKLHETGRFLETMPDLAIVAIEPMAEPWASWPDDPRVIGVPVAISLDRGVLEFNVNESDATSSLLDTVSGNIFEKGMGLNEMRRVPGVRLSDIMERIPADLPIEHLKTDVQGMDLAVLQSAGPHLRRVADVLTEIINEKVYEADRAGAMGTEKEFQDLMTSMNFSYVHDGATPERWWVNAYFTNDDWQGERPVTPMTVFLSKPGRLRPPK